MIRIPTTHWNGAAEFFSWAFTPSQEFIHAHAQISFRSFKDTRMLPRVSSAWYVYCQLWHQSHLCPWNNLILFVGFGLTLVWTIIIFVLCFGMLLDKVCICILQDKMSPEGQTWEVVQDRRWCHISTVIRFMINIPAASPVWLLAGFRPFLGIVVDQAERSIYCLTSANLHLRVRGVVSQCCDPVV